MTSILSHAESAEFRQETLRLMIKGYNGATIFRIFKSERERKGLKPINKSTVHKWVKNINQEGSKDYLYLMKDKTAYMVLHRRKLQALELYRTMIHDKIALMGGLAGIKPEALNRFIQSLLQITVTESRLEREIPSLFSNGENMNPEQVYDLEKEILAGLPADLREQFMKDQNRRQRMLEQVIGTKGKVGDSELIDLDTYPKDTYVI